MIRNPRPSRSSWRHAAALLGLIVLAAVPAAAPVAFARKPHGQVKSATVVRRTANSSLQADVDHDGLTTGTEKRRTKTNPRRFDTDGDGYGDGSEVAAGSNPRNPRSVPSGTPATPAPAPIVSPAQSVPVPPLPLPVPPPGEEPGVPPLPPLPPDTSPPQTTIDFGPAGTTTATGATFQFSSSESGSTFQCQLDSGPWGPCVSPKTYGGLAVGAHGFAVRATDRAGNTDGSAATRGWTVQSEASGAGCTQTLAAGASLSTALSSAGGGAVICLNTGTYAVNVTRANKSSAVTVKPAAGATPSIGYSILNQASNIRFQEVRFTGGIEVLGPASGIQLIGNEFVGPFGFHANGQYQSSRTEVTDVLISGNYMHDLDYTGSQGTANGYGITASNGVSRFTITGNTIKSPASDYIQSASPVNFTVDHNTFLGPSLLGSHQDHQDLWQIFGGGENITFTDNVARYTETQESLLFQEGAFTNVVVENNLFDHDSRGYTCQIYQSRGLIFRDNTIVGSHWGCLFRDLASASPGSGYQVDHNILVGTAEGPDIATEGRAGSWGTYDSNVSGDGSAQGAHSVRNWSPSWVDTTSYVPRGLPFAAGYRP